MPEKVYYRPLAHPDARVFDEALPLAGGSAWFDRVERLERGQPGQIVANSQVPPEVLVRLSTLREPICNLALDQPRLMGVLNVTPDSFSDGGKFDGFDAGVRQAEALVAEGADVLDIGGESTRPGADFVPPEVEASRTEPVIKTLRARGIAAPISIDTRKAGVAEAAIQAGAGLVNDVSALSFDEDMLRLVAASDAAICLMHASGDPKTMQDKPEYDDVLLDVYDYLHDRVALCVQNGISRHRILVDPGIGFGKTQTHNLALIRGLSLFHGLGCAVLLGVSRKRFIGTIGQEPQADRRAAGSIAVGLEGLRQGVQMLRVHDIRETRQAVLLWQALQGPL